MITRVGMTVAAASYFCPAFGGVLLWGALFGQVSREAAAAILLLAVVPSLLVCLVGVALVLSYQGRLR
jgi:hypothetical protein